MFHFNAPSRSSHSVWMEPRNPDSKTQLIFKTSQVSVTLRRIIHPLNTHKLLRITNFQCSLGVILWWSFWKSLLKSFTNRLLHLVCNSLCHFPPFDFLWMTPRRPLWRDDDWTCWVSAVDCTCRSREQLVIVINRDSERWFLSRCASRLRFDIMYSALSSLLLEE